MDKEEKKLIRLTAHMDGEAVTVRNIGKMVEVSQMELVALCNFAQLGLFALFSELEGEVGQTAAVEADILREAIKAQFANKSNPDGMNRLSTSAVAILAQERFGQYISE